MNQKKYWRKFLKIFFFVETIKYFHLKIKVLHKMYSFLDKENDGIVE